MDKQVYSKDNASEELARLEALETEVRTRELTIVKLYEITKKMSEGLKFETIFNILSVFLKDNFSFRGSELVILRESDGKAGIDRIYKVWGDGEVKDDESKMIDHIGVLKLFSQADKDIYLTRELNGAIFKRLGIDSEVRTFAAMPLLSENRIVGLLTIEDLPERERERFTILVMQFALEIKKVLLYETVEELAITDGLTGLYVRRYFLERVSEELKRSKRHKFKFSFLMMDLDNFKECNDTYGHLVGDVVLGEIGRIVKENIREIDLAARYGGEEFSLVLPETGKEEARLVGERLRKRIEEAVFKAYDEKLKINVSIGIATYPDDASAIDELIERSDKALYKAKRSGKNIVYLYET